MIKRITEFVKGVEWEVGLLGEKEMVVEGKELVDMRVDRANIGSGNEK